MFNPHSTTISTKILPLVYHNGEPAVVDNIFEQLELYEVIGGPHAGQRGTLNGLRELCGEVAVLDCFSAVSCETGDLLLRIGGAYRCASELVL